MVVHSSILVLWTKESGEPQSMGAQRVRHDGLTNTFTSLQFCGLVHGLSWRMSLMHLGKKKCILLFLDIVFCGYLLSPTVLLLSFKTIADLLIFCLDDMFTDVSGLC